MSLKTVCRNKYTVFILNGFSLCSLCPLWLILILNYDILMGYDFGAIAPRLAIERLNIAGNLIQLVAGKRRRRIMMDETSLSEKLDVILSEIGNLNIRFDNLESRFDNLESRFDNLESKFDRLEQDVEVLKQGQEANSRLLIELDTRLARVEETQERILHEQERMLDALEASGYLQR